MPFDVYGFWWVAGQRDKLQVPGHLHHDDDGSSELVVTGGLTSILTNATKSVGPDGAMSYEITESALDALGAVDRICGHAENRSYTLDGCVLKQDRGGMLGQSIRQTWTSSSLFRGAEFESDEEIAFDGCGFGLAWLEYWVRTGGLSEAAELSGEVGLRTWQISAQPQPTQSVQVDDMSVSITHSIKLSGDSIAFRQVAQAYRFELSFPSLTPLQEITREAGLLQHLVSAGLGRACPFTNFQATHPDVKKADHEGNQTKAPIDLLLEWSLQSSNQTAPKLHEVPFTMADLGGVDAIRQWIGTVRPYAASLDRVMASQYWDSMLISDKFLNCAVALEGYDKQKHQDDIIFRERLKRAATYAGTQMGEAVGDIDAWATAVKNLRNDIAHYSVRPNVSSVSQYFLWLSCYWAFLLCMLREASASEAVFQRIADLQIFQRMAAGTKDAVGVT